MANRSYMERLAATDTAHLVAERINGDISRTESLLLDIEIYDRRYIDMAQLLTDPQKSVFLRSPKDAHRILSKLRKFKPLPSDKFFSGREYKPYQAYIVEFPGMIQTWYETSNCLVQTNEYLHGPSRKIRGMSKSLILRLTNNGRLRHCEETGAWVYSVYHDKTRTRIPYDAVKAGLWIRNRYRKVITGTEFLEIQEPSVSRLDPRPVIPFSRPPECEKALLAPSRRVRFPGPVHLFGQALRASSLRESAIADMERVDRELVERYHRPVVVTRRDRPLPAPDWASDPSHPEYQRLLNMYE